MEGENHRDGNLPPIWRAFPQSADCSCTFAGAIYWSRKRPALLQQGFYHSKKRPALLQQGFYRSKFLPHFCRSISTLVFCSRTFAAAFQHYFLRQNHIVYIEQVISNWLFSAFFKYNMASKSLKTNIPTSHIQKPTPSSPSSPSHHKTPNLYLSKPLSKTQSDQYDRNNARQHEQLSRRPKT